MRTKSIFLLFAVIFSVLMLSGCGPEYQTVYSYVPPHSWRGRQCVNQCLTQRSYCQSECQSQDQTCRAEAQVAAMPAYLHHERKMRKEGQGDDFTTVSDYADYSNCTDSCGCAATYRSCFENCGGSVMANTQCVAFCPTPGVVQ